MTYRLDRAIQDHSWRQDADTKIAADPAPTWAEIKADCVGPDLPTKSDRMSPGHLDGVFFAHPFPGAADLRLTTDGLHFTVGDITLRYNGEAFHAPRYRVESTLPHPAAINAAGVHAEIHRVLAVVMGARVPDTASTDRLQDRLTDEMDRRRDVEAQLAKVTAERDALLIAESDLSKIAAALAIPALEPHDDALSMVKRLVDGYTVVSQRLAGSQKKVAERDATIEELRSALEAIAAHVGADPWAVEEIKVKVAEIAVKAGAVPALEKCVARLTEERDRARLTGQRLTNAAQNACRVLTDAGVAPPIKSGPADPATKAEARVKRLIRQRNAAHDVLDEAGIGLEVEGSPRWTLARRCRAAVAPVWGYLDALQAFDVVGEIVGVTGKTGERGFMDAVIARVKALHQEDADLLRLVSYHQAPIKFNARPLTLAERAAFVIRRLWQGRANAANEAASLRRELGDIADALGDLPGTAEREPIGDREEHLGLSAAERIRLSR